MSSLYNKHQKCGILENRMELYLKTLEWESFDFDFVMSTDNYSSFGVRCGFVN